MRLTRKFGQVHEKTEPEEAITCSAWLSFSKTIIRQNITINKMQNKHNSRSNTLIFWGTLMSLIRILIITPCAYQDHNSQPDLYLLLKPVFLKDRNFIYNTNPSLPWLVSKMLLNNQFPYYTTLKLKFTSNINFKPFSLSCVVTNHKSMSFLTFSLENPSVHEKNLKSKISVL